MATTWIYGTLAAITLAITCGFTARAVTASHERKAVDCDPSADGPADGTFLSALLPRANPCRDRMDELVASYYKRELEAVAAGIITAGLVVVTVTRRRRAEPTLPSSRVA